MDWSAVIALTPKQAESLVADVAARARVLGPSPMSKVAAPGWLEQLGQTLRTNPYARTLAAGGIGGLGGGLAGYLATPDDPEDPGKRWRNALTAMMGGAGLGAGSMLAYDQLQGLRGADSPLRDPGLSPKHPPKMTRVETSLGPMDVPTEHVGNAQQFAAQAQKVSPAVGEAGPGEIPAARSTATLAARSALPPAAVGAFDLFGRARYSEHPKLPRSLHPDYFDQALESLVGPPKVKPSSPLSLLGASTTLPADPTSVIRNLRPQEKMDIVMSGKGIPALNILPETLQAEINRQAASGKRPSFMSRFLQRAREPLLPTTKPPGNMFTRALRSRAGMYGLGALGGLANYGVTRRLERAQELENLKQLSLGLPPGSNVPEIPSR